MTKQTYFQLTEQGLKPVFSGTEEGFNEEIIRESNKAKDDAESHLLKAKEELSNITIEKTVEDMDFLELERYKLDYFDKLFRIKNIEHKLLSHEEQGIKDGYYFTMNSVGKDFEFEG